MSRRRRHAGAPEAPAAEAVDPASSSNEAVEADELATAEPEPTEAPAAEAVGVLDVTEPGAPSREWVNRSNDTVRLELCSLDSSEVHHLTIAPGQRLRAPAIYADMVRTRAPQMILEG